MDMDRQIEGHPEGNGGHCRSKRERESSSRKSKGSRRGREEEKKRRKKQSWKEDGGSGRKAVSWSDSSHASSDGDSEPESPTVEAVVREILIKFPDFSGGLKQVCRLIMDGHTIDVKGISNRPLVKHLRKLFRALKLKQNGDGFFLLPSRGIPTLEVICSILYSEVKPKEHSYSGSPNGVQFLQSDKKQDNGEADVGQLTKPNAKHDVSPPHKRRDADLEVNNDLCLGPPPAVVAEAEPCSEDSCFEEDSYTSIGVTRTQIKTPEPVDWFYHDQQAELHDLRQAVHVVMMGMAELRARLDVQDTQGGSACGSSETVQSPLSAPHRSAQQTPSSHVQSSPKVCDVLDWRLNVIGRARVIRGRSVAPHGYNFIVVDEALDKDVPVLTYVRSGQLLGDVVGVTITWPTAFLNIEDS